MFKATKHRRIVDWALQGLEGVDTSESKMVLAFGCVFTL